MNPTSAKKITMMIATMFTASLRSGVNASGDVSCMTPKMCHASRSPERAYPIKPISDVKVIAKRMRTYCDRSVISPHLIVPDIVAFRYMKISIIVTATMTASAIST